MRYGKPNILVGRGVSDEVCASLTPLESCAVDGALLLVLHEEERNRYRMGEKRTAMVAVSYTHLTLPTKRIV